MRYALAVGAWLFLALHSPGRADAQSKPARFLQFEEQLVSQLRARDPAAADSFRLAITTADSGNYARAAQLYADVRRRVPSFVHATRRLGLMENRLGHRDSSIALLTQAVDAEVSKENLCALAEVLVESKLNLKPLPEDQQQAFRLIDLAMEIDSSDVEVLYSACQVSLACQNSQQFMRATALLAPLHVEESPAHQYLAVRAFFLGHHSEARAELLRARQLGLPEQNYQEMLAWLRPPPPGPLERLALPAAWTFGIWIGAFLVLLGVGLVLSRLTLARSKQIPTSRDARITGADAFVRRLYGAVLWLSCAYYYVSVPLLLLVVVGLTLGLIFLAFRFGHVPIKLVLLVAAVGFITVSAILKSLFVRAQDQDPGDKLDLSAHPRLRTLLDQVASTIGTRAVDNVYMTPGAEVAVVERGGAWGQMGAAHRERCLILGAGALDGMRLGPFKAVLGHEYGHFSNRDTAGGEFSLAVRRSLGTMAFGIAKGGAASWFNPAWLYLHGFYRVFMHISQGASRLQEVLADRWAIYAYGSDAFISGLGYVVERAVHWEYHVQGTLTEVVEQKRPLANVYAYAPSSAPFETPESEALDKALHAKPSLMDSHPPPADRMQWARALGVPNANPSPDDDREAWELFSDREAIERGLTNDIREAMKLNYGIEIPAET